jgi:hypothetical protein
MIEKLDFKVDLPSVMEDINKILELSPWDDTHQIGLTHRPGATNPWKDAVGSLYAENGKDQLGDERDFTELNSQIPDTLKNLLLDFAQSQTIKLGRVRIMRLLSKRGLTVHRDTSVRYHLVLKTNIDSFFGFRDLKQTNGVAANCYHIPADGYFYKVDTTKIHFVYNGGKTDRIHIVIVPR